LNKILWKAEVMFSANFAVVSNVGEFAERNSNLRICAAVGKKEWSWCKFGA